MLEARNLHKEYKTKNGPVVKALDGVNIKFEETGMVFILGKSGSGKSTLLNVLGGLDKYDEGEVLVKGKSSKDFKQADFDSYRNTFIGFIFQDYNILEEFTISKNIELALELQGKKADKKSIEDLMEQVDLKGYGKRKPNTLSGGQRQRVAIARALVKNPEIIMADEPTGALDSNTGKQVLDTLKKLSKTKLVLIVSHDREFAEHYGDRIIELADGKIISDVSKYKSAPKDNDGLEIVDDKILTIKKGVKLDAKKTKVLNDFISNTEEDIIVSVDSKANKEFRKFAMIDEEGNKESFKSTENLDIKNYDPKRFKLIRSKLPGKDSLKMGASGLKTKPIRLFFTIILSAVAFALFGLADTMGSYDKVDNTIISLKDSQINYASFKKGLKNDPDDRWYRDAKLSQSDFDYLNSEIDGLTFTPVFSLNDNPTFSYRENIYNNEGISEYEGLYRSSLYGFVELSNDNLNNVGTIIAGELPDQDDEIVITKYTYDVFNKGEYSKNNTEEKIESLDDILGKKINSYYGNNKSFTIVGVIETNCDLSRYDRMNDDNFGQTTSDYMLSNEFNDFIQTSYHALGYLNKGYYINNLSKNGPFSHLQEGVSGTMANTSSDEWGNGYQYLATYSSDLDEEIVYFEDNKQGINDNEVIISLSALNNYEFDINGTKVNYYNITSSWCKENAFSERYNQLLMQLGLENYYWDVINYYGRFDTSTYSYNPYGNLWDYNNWNKEDLTEDQKNEINDFFMNFNVSYCIDVSQYFNLSSVNTKLNELYNLRKSQDSDIGYFEDYKQVIISRYNDNNYWPSHYDQDITNDEYKVINGAKRYVVEELKQYIPKKFFARYANNYDTPIEFDIVGVYVDVVNKDDLWQPGLISNYIANELKDSMGGVYNFAISSLDYNNDSLLREVVEFTYNEGERVVYSLNNPVMSSMKEINSMIETLSQVFLYVGIGFAVFAALLLLNFITISISYKKREIGVLRAIGARGMDVFKIFFNEAFIIAFINFILAAVGSVAICIIINGVIRNDYGMLITILNIGVRQIILMFAVSLLVAFISSFFPVYTIARKKPIDAIRNS